MLAIEATSMISSSSNVVLLGYVGLKFKNGLTCIENEQLSTYILEICDSKKNLKAEFLETLYISMKKACFSTNPSEWIYRHPKPSEGNHEVQTHTSVFIYSRAKACETGLQIAKNIVLFSKHS